MSQFKGVEIRHNVRIPMRDGVHLLADIYLPKADGPFPTILARNALDRSGSMGGEDKAISLAKEGYATVVQSFRGRYDSEGTAIPFHGQSNDGYDTQEWIGTQPWCNGRIGTYGRSYMGIVQWQAAQHGSDYLKCMAPHVAPLDHVNDALAPGGAFQLTWMMLLAMADIVTGRSPRDYRQHNWTEVYRALPLVDFDDLMGADIPYWKQWIQQPLDASYWTDLNVEDKFSAITAPAFGVDGWYDIHVRSAFEYFNGQRQHGPTPEARMSKLIVGPWMHNFTGSSRTGEIDFGEDSVVDLDAPELRWFDYWLKGIDDGIVDEPPLRLFVMGINQWRDEEEWPLARTDWQHWYLHSDGQANTVRGDGALAPLPPSDEQPDHFVYDPDYPVQTIGGNSLDSNFAGAYDQRPAEMRSDVLCYTSDVLQADLEVTGPIKLVLFAETDGLDTDWTAKLVDVSPTGYAKILCDGIVRARYRNGFGQPELLIPNHVYEYEIEVGVTSNVFRAGHRIQLDVSSSNFPRFDRNPNTGHPIGLDSDLRTAHQTVHHSSLYPSHLVLPVIPGNH